MAITYKTVIAEAIKGFQNVRDSLADYTALGISKTSVSGGTVQNSLTPTDLANNIGKMTTIRLADGTFINRKDGVPIYEGGTIKPESGTDNSIQHVDTLPTPSQELDGRVVIYNDRLYICLPNKEE